MGASPIPPGTLSTVGVGATVVAAIAGKFDGHPGWLCLALGIVAAVAIARGLTEAWKTKGTAAVLALLLLASPALADGPQLRAPMPADVAAVPLVPPEAVVPTCPPPAPVVKPAPSWATYLGFGLAAATEILTLAVTLTQRAP